jgi:hypothetical protein
VRHTVWVAWQVRRRRSLCGVLSGRGAGHLRDVRCPLVAGQRCAGDGRAREWTARAGPSSRGPSRASGANPVRHRGGRAPRGGSCESGGTGLCRVGCAASAGQSDAGEARLRRRVAEEARPRTGGAVVVGSRTWTVNTSPVVCILLTPGLFPDITSACKADWRTSDSPASRRRPGAW